MIMGDNQLKNQNQKPNLTVDVGSKKSKTQFYDWNLGDWRVLGCSQEPDESDHVSNFGLRMAKVGGIRPPRRVSKNNLTKCWSKLAVFQQTIKYITNIWHVGIQVSYMVGKLLKLRIFRYKLFWVISYSVGTGTFIFTWSGSWPISSHRLVRKAPGRYVSPSLLLKIIAIKLMQEYHNFYLGH